MQGVESADMCVQMYGTEVESRPKNNTQVKYGYLKKVFVFVTHTSAADVHQKNPRNIRLYL